MKSCGKCITFQEDKVDVILIVRMLLNLRERKVEKFRPEFFRSSFASA